MAMLTLQGWMSILAGFIFVSILIPLLCRPAERLGLLDLPADRKIHGEPVPMIGGIAMFIAFSAGLLIIPEPLRPYASLVMGMGILLATGLVDDAFDITPASKLIMQLLAISLMVSWGEIQVQTLGDLLGTGNINLGEWAIPFTALCTIFMINGMNLADGTDGMAGGYAVIILVVVGILGALNGVGAAFSAIAFLLAAVTCGFLLFNLRTPWRRKARVFMGDAGSMMLGFAIAWLAILVTQHPAATVPPVTIAWLLVLPVTDLVSSYFRRLLRGQSPFSADREHLHHVLLRVGFPVGRVVAVMLLVELFFGLVGLMGWRLGWPEYYLGYGVLCIFALHYVLSIRAWKIMRWLKARGLSRGD